MMKHKLRIRVLLTILAITSAALLSPSNLSAQAFTSTEVPEGRQVSSDPAPRRITGDEIFRNLVEHSHLRDQLLERYSVVDTYVVGNPTGKVYARSVVQVQYRAPDKKMFTTKSEQGSWMVRRLVLNRLIESQEKTSSGRDHRDSSISPRNYSFNLLGEEQVGPYACYVLEATPKREDKYLFQGRIWISKQDFGIVKIAGHPARKLSFWIERVDFVRQYQKIGPFWLPQRDSTVARVRWNGKKILTIDHADYTINGQKGERINAEIRPRNSREIDFRPGPLGLARSTTGSQDSAARATGLKGAMAKPDSEPVTFLRSPGVSNLYANDSGKARD